MCACVSVCVCFSLSLSASRSFSSEKFCLSSCTHIQGDSQLHVWLQTLYCETTSAWLLHKTTIRERKMSHVFTEPSIHPLCIQLASLWQGEDCECQIRPIKMCWWGNTTIAVNAEPSGCVLCERSCSVINYIELSSDYGDLQRFLACFFYCIGFMAHLLYGSASPL